MEAFAIADIQIRGSPLTGSTAFESPMMRPMSGRPHEDSVRTGQEAQVAPEAVRLAAEGVNAFLKSSGSHVQFEFHQQARQMMVEVIDDRTQEVIRTIPSKELLDLAAKIGEMVGLLLDKKG